jgi:hypothetical protein
VCFALAVAGTALAAFTDRPEPGNALGWFLFLGTMLAWSWYSGLWRTFARAGKPGPLCLVPFYNGMVFLEIAQKPGWWAILWLVPGAQVVGVRVMQALSERLGRSAIVPVALFLLGAAPFYYFVIPFIYLGFVEQVGHPGQISGLGVKAFIAAIHVSILWGGLPLEGGRRRPASEGRLI